MFDLAGYIFSNVWFTEPEMKGVCVCSYILYRFCLHCNQHLVGTQLAHSWSFIQTHTQARTTSRVKNMIQPVKMNEKIITGNVGTRRRIITRTQTGGDLSVMDRCSSVSRETHKPFLNMRCSAVLCPRVLALIHQGYQGCIVCSLARAYGIC